MVAKRLLRLKEKSFLPFGYVCGPAQSPESAVQADVAAWIDLWAISYVNPWPGNIILTQGTDCPALSAYYILGPDNRCLGVVFSFNTLAGAMPLGKRTDFGDSRYAGVTIPYSHDVGEAMQVVVWGWLPVRY
jgi:hypothetical protein